MVVLNLNLVSKTVPTSLVLAVPADRIGSGANVIDHNPTAFLSPGHFFLPRLPEPEPRSRRTADDQPSMPPSGLPSGPAGSGSGQLALLARTATATVKPTVAMTLRRAVKPSRVRYPQATPCQRGWRRMATSAAK
jgi:hypothetical protein